MTEHHDSGEAGGKGAAGDSAGRTSFSGGTMRFVSAGAELAAAVGGSCLVGYWIDGHFRTSPWGLVICAILGVVGALYNLVRPALRTSLRMTTGDQASGRGQQRTGNGRDDDAG